MLEEPFGEISAGSHDFKRLLAAASRTVQDQTWLGAIEIEGNNCPWDVPKNLNKVNAVVRYSRKQSINLSITHKSGVSAVYGMIEIPVIFRERILPTEWMTKFVRIYGASKPSDNGVSASAIEAEAEVEVEVAWSVHALLSRKLVRWRGSR